MREWDSLMPLLEGLLGAEREFNRAKSNLGVTRRVVMDHRMGAGG